MDDVVTARGGIGFDVMVAAGSGALRRIKVHGYNSVLLRVFQAIRNPPVDARVWLSDENRDVRREPSWHGTRLMFGAAGTVSHHPCILGPWPDGAMPRGPCGADKGSQRPYFVDTRCCVGPTMPVVGQASQGVAGGRGVVPTPRQQLHHWVLVGKGGIRGSQVGNDKEMAEIILFEKDRYHDPDVWGRITPLHRHTGEMWNAEHGEIGRQEDPLPGAEETYINLVRS